MAPLLNVHKKYIRDAIERRGLSYQEFGLETRPHFKSALPIPALVHYKTGYYFEFHFDKDGWEKVFYFPSADLPNRICKAAEAWKFQRHHLDEWLDIVTEEIKAIDYLTDDYAKAWAGPNFTEAEKNEPLNQEEQQKAIRALLTAKEIILADTRFKDSVKTDVSSKIDKLINEAPTLTKAQFISRFMEAIQPAVKNIGYNIVANLLFEAGKYLLS